MSFSWSKRSRIPKNALYRLAAAAVILILVGILLFIIIDKNASPVIIVMAEAKVRSLAVKSMNDSVRSIMSNPLKYTDLIKIVQNEEGKITMIQADTIKMNDIATTTALTSQENIAMISESGVGIPLGSVFGSELLAGRGPIITARIIPVGSVTTDFESEFQSQGINQTRHKIYLNVHAVVRIVIPTRSEQINVDTKVLITECIIIGEVPESFVNVTDPNDLNMVPFVTDQTE